MIKYQYIARLDWGPPMTLTYDGPLVDLAVAEAQRRCIHNPSGLKGVTRRTTETVYQKEPPNA